VITYHRGQITVLDRPRLEQLTCECYAVVKKETDRLMPLSSAHLACNSPVTESFRPRTTEAPLAGGAADIKNRDVAK
jgi:hypothetical protein